MITINNKKFAETEKEFAELSDAGATCSGYAIRSRTKITLQNRRKEKIGLINKYGVLCKAAKLDSGKYFYSYGQIEEIGPIGYAEKNKQIDQLAVSRRFSKGEFEYFFK